MKTKTCIRCQTPTVYSTSILCEDCRAAVRADRKPKHRPAWSGEAKRRTMRRKAAAKQQQARIRRDTEEQEQLRRDAALTPAMRDARAARRRYEATKKERDVAFANTVEFWIIHPELGMHWLEVRCRDIYPKKLLNVYERDLYTKQREVWVQHNKDQQLRRDTESMM